MIPARCWPAVLSALAAALQCGCVPTPESYPIPEQHQPFHPQPLTSTEFVGVADANASSFFLRDIQEGKPGSWRWTGAEPELGFVLQSRTNRQLFFDFVIHDTTFAGTGPLTILFKVNDCVLSRERYDTAGHKNLLQPVPDACLTPEGQVRVTARIENPWRSTDGTILGILIKRAGFLP